MAEGKILPYLDIPFQHANPRILKLMKRPAAAEKTLERIQAWRKLCPDLTIRSTFIAGFPGETEGEFQELLDYLTDAQLDRVGCFAYSPVDGAKANELPDAVPAELREERQARFMAHQEAISRTRLKAKIGRSIDVLVDRLAEDDKGNRIAIGRSKADAPEIDGMVYVTGVSKKLQAGEFLRAKVIDAQEHDLVAELAS